MNKEHTIPQTLEERTRLRKALSDFVQKQNLCPPVSLKQLEELADTFLASPSAANAQSSMVNGQCSMFNVQSSIFNNYRPWLMVEIHNQLWLPVVAGIPHERRLLMLPKCLSKYGALDTVTMVMQHGHLVRMPGE